MMVTTPLHVMLVPVARGYLFQSAFGVGCAQSIVVCALSTFALQLLVAVFFMQVPQLELRNACADPSVRCWHCCVVRTNCMSVGPISLPRSLITQSKGKLEEHVPACQSKT
eukprot:4561013-Amphidinium_carterae.1